MNHTRTTLLAAILIVLILPGTIHATNRADPVVDPDVYAELNRTSEGRVYVLVVLQPLQSRIATLEQRKAAVAAIQGQVLVTVLPQDFEVVYRYQTFPGLTGWASASGLAVLETHPDVIRVGLDETGEGFLDVSVPFINADQVQALGITGQGITVAVLDTGIDSAHNDLSDNIATGAYHFLNQGMDIGPGAVDGHGHGTHIAGIITSNGTDAPVGVAPDTDILAIKVLDDNNNGNVSDWAAGVDHVVLNMGSYAHLCAINMSFGTYGYSACPCDNQDSFTMLMQAAVQAAKANGIVCFAASGNNGACNLISSPACLSATTAVASVYDQNYGAIDWFFGGEFVCSDGGSAPDWITCFTQRSGCNDLAAPGAFIASSQLGGGWVEMSGTSMATPHVVGVAALMCEKADDLGTQLTPDQIVQIMKDTGQPTFDPCETEPNPIRVDALAAVSAVDTTQACAGLIDFEDDPQVGANITCNPDAGPYECNPSHHNWLLAKGIDITGTPNGYLFTNQISGPVGQTGVFIGYAAPDYGEADEGLSDNEMLSIHFQSAPAQDVELVLTVSPITANNNVSSTVYLDAYDAGSSLVASDTLTFTGVTNGNHTPGAISVSRPVPDIFRIDLSVDTPHAVEGIYLESVECGSVVSVPEIAQVAPFTLYPNNPNPFNPATEIRYELFTPVPVRLQIYDTAGRLVRTLVDAPLQRPGPHSLRWDGRDGYGATVASGVYFYRLEAGEYGKTRRMALIR